MSATEVISIVCKDAETARATLAALRRGLRMAEVETRQGIKAVKMSPVPKSPTIVVDNDGQPMTIEDLDKAIDRELKKRRK